MTSTSKRNFLKQRQPHNSSLFTQRITFVFPFSNANYLQRVTFEPGIFPLRYALYWRVIFLEVVSSRIILEIYTNQILHARPHFGVLFVGAFLILISCLDIFTHSYLKWFSKRMKPVFKTMSCSARTWWFAFLINTCLRARYLTARNRHSLMFFLSAPKSTKV